MSQKVIGIALSALLFALCFSAEAQQSRTVFKIGYLGAGGSAPPQAFLQALHDLGYVEGKNITIEYRTPGEKSVRWSADLAAELVRLKVDVIVAEGAGAISAAKNASATIPIVMAHVNDPIVLGLVASLAHPGGNITGLTTISRELSGKRLELVKEVIPEISRVGVLWDENSQGGNIGFKEYEAAARDLKIQLQSLKVRGQSPDFDAAFQAAAKGRAGAIIPIRSVELTRHLKRATDLAIKNPIPSMCERNEYVEVGCLMSYATNDADQFRRAAVYVDKILKGAKPADLPVEQPKKFDFVINLKTAKQIGLTIPPNVLARADKVIR